MPRLLRAAERGQVVMFTAILIPVIIGMAGIAVDIGGYASNRRTLQNAADSIALAAAQQLPDSVSAQSAATTYAQRNGIDPAQVTVSITGGDTDPTVRATVTRTHDFAFIRALGLSSKGVAASATAKKVSYGGSSGIVPWSVTQATVDAATSGALVTMKYDATGADTGNFGAIRIDGPGAATYETSVKYGSSTVACAVSAPNCTPSACPGTYPSVCAETAPECDGPECTPQTGNVIGPTADGVDFRMDNTLTSCDSFDEVFTDSDNDGKYQLEPDCNPWLDGPGKCLATTSICSRRVIMIPVVDTFGNGGSDPAEIQRFALVFLEGYEDGKCSGNSCEIQGRFVRADVNTRALAGTYDQEALVHFAKLTE